MKTIVINSKGGATKSTTAIQLLVPYLFEKNSQEVVKLFEFDDENEDSLTFQKSELLDAQRYLVSGGNIEVDLTNIIFDNDQFVIDVGGNKTTTILLDTLKASGLIDELDIVVIPLLDGEQDAINAINTYNRIKELSNAIKIIFVLGRVDRSMPLQIQFFDLFGDETWERIDGRAGLIEKIKEEDRNFFEVYNSETIKVSRAFSITVSEIAEQNVSDLKAKLKEATKNKDIKRAKRLSYRIGLVNKAVAFRNNCLKPSFEKLDEILK
jgi:hypothetical protein